VDSPFWPQPRHTCPQQAGHPGQQQETGGEHGAPVPHLKHQAAQQDNKGEEVDEQDILEDIVYLGPDQAGPGRAGPIHSVYTSLTPGGLVTYVNAM
jgi:hypothetical protein